MKLPRRKKRSDFFPHDHCEYGWTGECFAESMCLREGSSCSRYWAETIATEIPVETTRAEQKKIELALQRLREIGYEDGHSVSTALQRFATDCLREQEKIE